MKNLKLNALANTLLKILNIVFPLITTPYLTRLLDVNDYADFNNANTYISLFIPIAAFGIYNYGIREISNNKDNKNKVNEIFSTLFYTGAITAITTFLIYFIIIQYKEVSNYYLYLILGFQILFQFLYIEWVNEAIENYGFILYKTLFIRIVMLLSIFIFVKTPKDIIPYAVIMTATTILNFIISFIWIKREIKLVTVPVKYILKSLYSLIPVFLLANVNMLYTVLDRVYLEYSPNKVDISYYTLSLTIVTIITSVIYGSISVNIPRLGYYLGIKDQKSYINLLITGTKYFMFFVIPICFGLMILGPYVMIIAFGEKYTAGGILITIFAIRTIFWAVEVILGQQIIFINGYESKLTLFYFIGGLVNLTFNSIILLTKTMNPMVILLSTIASEFIVIILEIIFIKRKDIINIKEIIFIPLKYTFLSSVFIPIYYVYKNIIKIDLILNTSLIINITTIIFLCSAYYMFILFITKDKVFYELIKLITKRK